MFFIRREPKLTVEKCKNMAATKENAERLITISHREAKDDFTRFETEAML